MSWWEINTKPLDSFGCVKLKQRKLMKRVWPTRLASIFEHCHGRKLMQITIRQRVWLHNYLNSDLFVGLGYWGRSAMREQLTSLFGVSEQRLSEIRGYGPKGKHSTWAGVGQLSLPLQAHHTSAYTIGNRRWWS
jgi:hypothetical protein